LQSIARDYDFAGIADRIAAVRDKVRAAALRAGRDPDGVHLIGVSKTQPAEAVAAAWSAGLRDFGENYLNEALGKIQASADLDCTWHFIGAIQSNKTRPLAEHFDWVHTVDREKIARRLDSQCPPQKRLNVCLQVNVDRDKNKAGVMPENAGALLTALSGFARLDVRGLMTILHPASDPSAGYGRLAELFESLRHLGGPSWDTLSMGMSGDFEAAIAAGATHVRIGTAIFGPRRADT
jgi:hypothetical protein